MRSAQVCMAHLSQKANMTSKNPNSKLSQKRSLVQPVTRRRIACPLQAALLSAFAKKTVMKLLCRQFLHLAAGAAVLPAMPRIASAQSYLLRTACGIACFAAGGAVVVFERLHSNARFASCTSGVVRGQMRNSLHAIGFALSTFAALISGAAAQTAADFKGATIGINIFGSTGGGYDTYGRLTAVDEV